MSKCVYPLTKQLTLTDTVWELLRISLDSTSWTYDDTKFGMLASKKIYVLFCTLMQIHHSCYIILQSHPKPFLGVYSHKYITRLPYHTFPLWNSELSYLLFKKIFCLVGIFIFVPRAHLGGCNEWRQHKMGWNRDTTCRSAFNRNKIASERNRNILEVP